MNSQLMININENRSMMMEFNYEQRHASSELLHSYESLSEMKAPRNK
jgi:7-cyano-7-deazaguanine synthase in queuosine biosynthesis